MTSMKRMREIALWGVLALTALYFVGTAGNPEYEAIRTDIVTNK